MTYPPYTILDLINLMNQMHFWQTQGQGPAVPVFPDPTPIDPAIQTFVNVDLPAPDPYMFGDIYFGPPRPVDPVPPSGGPMPPELHDILKQWDFGKPGELMMPQAQSGQMTTDESVIVEEGSETAFYDGADDVMGFYDLNNNSEEVNKGDEDEALDIVSILAIDDNDADTAIVSFIEDTEVKEVAVEANTDKAVVAIEPPVVIEDVVQIDVI